MSSPNNQELSVADVEFLQAVRHIEQNPEGFDSVEVAEGRATTQALNRLLQEEWKTVNEWTDGKISYRMNPPSRAEGSRGWGVDNGFGLVRLHDAEIRPKVGWTSRSVELTEKGLKRLAKRESELNISRSEDTGSGAEEIDSKAMEMELDVQELQEEVEELREENEQLRETVETLVEDVSQWKSSPTGAFDSEMSDRFDQVFQTMVKQTRLNQLVFEVDLDAFSPENQPDKDDVGRVRDSVRSTLLNADE